VAVTAHIFPANYMWSLAAMIAFNSGGAAGEILGLCNSKEMQKASETGDDKTWVAVWSGMAQRVEQLAASEAAAGHDLSAGQTYARAAVYYQVAERFLEDHDARNEMFATSQRLFREFCARRPEPIEVVQFPYDDHTLEAYLLPAAARSVPECGQVPCVVFLDGLDATAETMAMRALPLTERGIACMVIDGPGWGASLRLKGLTTRYDYEVVASAAVDCLELRPEIDPDRLGIMAISLGGYYAPRVAAFEPRFSAGAAWGAIWDYPSVLQRRLEREWTSSSAVSAPKHQAAWVFGVDSLEEAVSAAERFRLDGVAQKVTCPFLVVHGEADAQIPLSDAQALYDALGSEDKEMRVFSRQETGAEHCQWDNVVMAQHHIFDWFADRFHTQPLG
jgi:dipeptidyl aminopeptidase/acylaminoacyl peptidase